ncbi:hypothetical protein AB0M46_32855 [Dactylosporangium sp. NPDC051485]|uniref:hypothetical protein n=1 Tax=Dactylosporangium sp. NPDC051485 TaxID=3154846 RepID=UPI003424AB08
MLEPAEGRFRLHDLLREYAAGLAAADPGHAEATDRLLDWYVAATAAATRFWEPRRDRGAVDDLPGVPGTPTFADLAATRAWLDREIANLIAAVHLADRLGRHRHAALLTRALWGYLFRNSMNDVSIDLHRRALAGAEALADDELAAMAHNYLASAYARAGHLDDAAHHLGRIVEHPGWGFRARNNLAAVYLYAGRLREALALLEDSMLAVYGADRSWAFGQWTSLATILQQLGRTGEALTVARRAHAVGRLDRLPSLAANARFELAVIHQRLGHHRLAALLLRALLADPSPEIGPALACLARSQLGLAELALDRPGDGLDLLAAAHRAAEPLEPHVACLTGNNLGTGLRLAGRPGDAAPVYAAVLDQARRMGYRHEQARALHGLGLCTGDPAALREAADLFARMGAQ